MRFRKVNIAFAVLMAEHGWNIFSPITHSHPVHEVGLRGDWTYWKKVDIEYLRLSKRVVVLKIDGWQESIGVQEEIKIAKSLKIPVLYMNPDTHKLSIHP